MIPKLTALARSRSVARQLLGRPAQHLGGRGAVHVLPAPERLGQHRLAGQVGEDAQLDLRVVGRQQPHPVGRDEGAPDLLAELRAHGDVLQVRVGAGEAAGARGGLPERRVDAPVRGDGLRQRDEVRRVQLRQLAPALDDGDDRVQVADLRRARAGRSSSPSCPCGRRAGRASRTAPRRAASASRSRTGRRPPCRRCPRAPRPRPPRARGCRRARPGRRARRRPPWPPARRPAAARCRPGGASGGAPRGARPCARAGAPGASAARPTSASCSGPSISMPMPASASRSSSA